jgi:hypothetical protein
MGSCASARSALPLIIPFSAGGRRTERPEAAALPGCFLLGCFLLGKQEQVTSPPGCGLDAQGRTSVCAEPSS